MALDITVDETRCIGSANCEFHAMNTFEVQDDNKSHVIDPEGDPEEDVVRAAEGCPTGAISVVKDGQKLV